MRQKYIEMERKLKSLDKKHDLFGVDLIQLMKDENLVDRYSKHLNALMFSFQKDDFIKAKYLAYLALTEPNTNQSFFNRMQHDQKQRKVRQKHREHCH